MPWNLRDSEEFFKRVVREDIKGWMLVQISMRDDDALRCLSLSLYASSERLKAKIDRGKIFLGQGHKLWLDLSHIENGGLKTQPLWFITCLEVAWLATYLASDLLNLEQHHQWLHPTLYGLLGASVLLDLVHPRLQKK